MPVCRVQSSKVWVITLLVTMSLSVHRQLGEGGGGGGATPHILVVTSGNEENIFKRVKKLIERNNHFP